MDQMMVDLSGIPLAGRGSVATLIGKDGEEEITLKGASGVMVAFNRVGSALWNRHGGFHIFPKGSSGGNLCSFIAAYVEPAQSGETFGQAKPDKANQGRISQLAFGYCAASAE